MIDRRGGGETAAMRPARRQKKSSGCRPKRKFSFKDKHALAAVGGRMTALQSTITGLRADLADPDLFGRDAAAFTIKSEALEAAENSLAAAEEEWLALEMRREEADGE